MREQSNIFHNLDWPTILLYLVFVLLGWFNIYAAVYNEEHSSILDLSQSYGKQLLWIVTSIGIAVVILSIDGKFYAAFSYVFYLLIIVLLVGVLLFGAGVKESKSWFEIGGFKLQPSEFAKFATNMALAKFLSTLDIKIQDLKTKIVSAVIILLPMSLVILQNDTGTALVFTSFIFVLYREGLSGNFLLLGVFGALIFILALLIDKIGLMSVLVGLAVLMFIILKKSKGMIVSLLAALVLSVGAVYSVDYVFDNVLEPHQKKRINVLLGKETDLKGAGYNVNQSKIAIGSGGVLGKGFLNGTQTKFDFVPEQSTDFIFCTVGEEWGFAGSVVIIALFLVLFLRLIYLAERQRSAYGRIFGYGVASIMFFHFLVNIGMTIGLAPVIGIPLPFFSYGGSSLWGFTILLFIFLKLDAYRLYILR